MTLVEIRNLFSEDDRCREMLERLRWPDGPQCPRCQTREVVRLENNAKILCCKQCSYPFTVTAGTVFHDSHLPLMKWFIAAHLLCESRKGISANQIKRMLGVSYKTAWYLCHRIRAAMQEADQGMLGGTLEIEETYSGGKARKDRPSSKKQAVLGIRQRNGDLRFIRPKEVTAATIRAIVEENGSEAVDVIVTDESLVYYYGLDGKRHKVITHKNELVRGNIHTNTGENAFSLLKRGIVGAWHKVSAKHLPAYLTEMTFRFNRRERSDLLMDTLRHMVTAPVLTFKKLTA